MWKKPWLLLPPQLAHDLSPLFLKLHGQLFSPRSLKWDSFDWRGLHFDNPLGIAGGVDKNVDCLKGWWSFGPGFVEVGTLTPLPQE
ncbi:MAG: quinone-dependent dihydroorotate dehydrogenase, partial [Bdellovibrionales bacterium]|nr:quinone-dependent dihydroorotate dehydrogenase [Bdellovibrionales bacterium]